MRLLSGQGFKDASLARSDPTLPSVIFQTPAVRCPDGVELPTVACPPFSGVASISKPAVDWVPIPTEGWNCCLLTHGFYRMDCPVNRMTG